MSTTRQVNSPKLGRGEIVGRLKHKIVRARLLVVAERNSLISCLKSRGIIRTFECVESDGGDQPHNPFSCRPHYVRALLGSEASAGAACTTHSCNRLFGRSCCNRQLNLVLQGTPVTRAFGTGYRGAGKPSVAKIQFFMGSNMRSATDIQIASVSPIRKQAGEAAERALASAVPNLHCKLAGAACIGGCDTGIPPNPLYTPLDSPSPLSTACMPMCDCESSKPMCNF